MIVTQLNRGVQMKSRTVVGRNQICSGVEAIDTRLVATVQARAGSRVHEAAGLLQSYFLWSHLMGHATERSSPSVSVATREVCNARRRLREFLSRRHQISNNIAVIRDAVEGLGMREASTGSRLN